MKHFPWDMFLFRGLSEAERNTLLCEAPPPEPFEKGAVIYSAAHFRKAIGVVVRGEVLILRDAAVLNRLGVGAVFGAAEHRVLTYLCQHTDENGLVTLSPTA